MVCTGVVCHLLKLLLTAEPLCPVPHPHFPLDRPGKGVECVLHGSPSVLEKAVTSKGCVKGNTLCLSISGLLLKPVCVWYLSSAADLNFTALQATTDYPVILLLMINILSLNVQPYFKVENRAIITKESLWQS